MVPIGDVSSCIKRTPSSSGLTAHWYTVLTSTVPPSNYNRQMPTDMALKWKTKRTVARAIVRHVLLQHLKAGQKGSCLTESTFQGLLMEPFYNSLIHCYYDSSRIQDHLMEYTEKCIARVRKSSSFVALRRVSKIHFPECIFWISVCLNRI